MSAHVVLSAVLVICCYVTGQVMDQSVCGDTGPLWLNNNISCPARAVCADVFTGQRNWGGGNTCEAKRILSRCLCNGNTVCQYNSPDHRLYSSKTHEQYTCQATCNLPYCPNIQFGSQGPRGGRVTARTMKQDSPDFNDRNYYRIDCRCPRNHVRPTQRRQRTYVQQGNTFDWTTRLYSTLYRCDQTEAEASMPDPCDD